MRGVDPAIKALTDVSLSTQPRGSSVNIFRVLPTSTKEYKGMLEGIIEREITITSQTKFNR